MHRNQKKADRNRHKADRPPPDVDEVILAVDADVPTRKCGSYKRTVEQI
jgi:hypothetical protein